MFVLKLFEPVTVSVFSDLRGGARGEYNKLDGRVKIKLLNKAPRSSALCANKLQIELLQKLV